MSSPRFVLMCTRMGSEHLKDLKDFLHCQEDFHHKSANFLKSAVNEIMQRRLNRSLQIIHELLQYHDIDRTVNASQQLTSIVNKRRQSLEVNLRSILAAYLHPVRADLNLHITKNLAENWRFSTILLGSKSLWNDTVKTIGKKFEESMAKHSVIIERKVEETIDHFFVSLDLHPDQEQLAKQAITRVFHQNPYTIVIGQHEFQSALSRTKERAWAQTESVSTDFINRILKLLLTPLRFLKNLRKATEEILIETVEPNIQKVIDRFFGDIVGEFESSIREHIKKVLDEVEAKKEALLKTKSIEQVIAVAEFISTHERSIIQLYFNLQHAQSLTKYAIFEISNEKLGSSNSCVCVAHLAVDEHSERVPIAAKKVNRHEFCYQDLYYIDNNHRNIVKLYGLRRSDRNGSYYILMEKLDCDLSNYLLENHTHLLDSHIDKMIMDIISGLHYLHKRTLIHCNITFTNILVRKSQPPIFLIGGLSFPHGLSSSIAATPCHMAHEATNASNHTNNATRSNIDRFAYGYADNNSLTTKTDIYALGITIREIYTRSNITRLNKYHKFWSSIANRCCSSNCAKRPTCEEILAERRSCIKQKGKDSAI